MYERHHQPLISQIAFLQRMLRHWLASLAIVALSLGIGMVGYHWLEGFPWVDSFLNASMILGGMGPVNGLQTDGGKIFAGLYALYSGLILLVIAGILLAPVLHRILHHFHLNTEEGIPPNKSRSGAPHIHD
jgi:hypothetical protein